MYKTIINYELLFKNYIIKKRKIADLPENYGLLVVDMINEINLWYESEKINTILDKHFYRKIDQDKFDDFLKSNMANKLDYAVEHVDSKNNYLVNIADMAAGAVLRKYNKKDLEFYNIIKDNIMVEKIISWPEIKKIHLNRRTRPSK